jgi:hypothetical protein
MKKQFVITTILAIMLYGSGLAQEDQNKTIKSCMFRPTSFEMQLGGTTSHYTATMNDFKEMKEQAPFGTFINIVPDSFDYQNAQRSGSFSFRIDIGLSPFSKKNNAYRENRELKICIGSNMGKTNQFSFVKRTTVRYDTLQNTHGDIVEYIDSVYEKNYSYSQYIHEINLGASYIFKTNTAKKVSFFAGGGFEYGFSVISQITEQVWSESYFSPSYGDSSYYYDNDIDKTTININKTNHFARVFIPLGINYRLSNKSNFFKHINFDVQLSPGLVFTLVNKVSSLHPYTYIAVGYKYSW